MDEFQNSSLRSEIDGRVRFPKSWDKTRCPNCRSAGLKMVFGAARFRPASARHRLCPLFPLPKPERVNAALKSSIDRSWLRRGDSLKTMSGSFSDEIKENSLAWDSRWEDESPLPLPLLPAAH